VTSPRLKRQCPFGSDELSSHRVGRKLRPRAANLKLEIPQMPFVAASARSGSPGKNKLSVPILSTFFRREGGKSQTQTIRFNPPRVGNDGGGLKSTLGASVLFLSLQRSSTTPVEKNRLGGTKQRVMTTFRPQKRRFRTLKYAAFEQVYVLFSLSCEWSERETKGPPPPNLGCKTVKCRQPVHNQWFTVGSPANYSPCIPVKSSSL
jgi:hypothetical protein